MLAAFGSALAGSLAEGIGNKIFGGGTSVNKQLKANQQMAYYQMQLQKEYDADSIQRRVKDAEAAGVSPMAALGMTPSGGASFVGNTPDYNAVKGDSSMGQSMGRAIAAAADPMTRMNLRLANAQVEGQELDNEYKRSQIAQMRGQLGPAMPGVSSKAFDDGQSVPMYSTVMTPNGPRRMVSPEYGQIMENDFSEFMRYLVRDFGDRSKRLSAAAGPVFRRLGNWWSRAGRASRSPYN